MIHLKFTRLQLNIVQFCANECHNQSSGEKSVARMVWAYNEALSHCMINDNEITESFVCKIATLIDPRNERGYRTTPVVFEQEWEPACKPEHIQRQMELLLENGDKQTVDEFTKRFLEIHPFEDGNGRVAAILYNVANRTIEAPQPLPVYFGEKV